jgi:APA family basic amino acid/polyamine antiporter
MDIAFGLERRYGPGVQSPLHQREAGRAGQANHGGNTMSTTQADLSGTTASGAGAGGLYTRQASGLVRDISPAAGIALNVSFVSIPLAVLIATQAPSAFPGASPFWVTVFAGVLCLFPVLLYALFTAVMPRAGGDYVFVSRTLHPWVGFAANFNITAWYLLVIAYFGYLLTPFGVSTAFATIGATAHSATFTRWATEVTTKGWEFGAGLMSFSLRRALQIYKWLFAISLVGVAIAIVLLIFNGRGDFRSAVAHYGGSYNGIIAAAHKAGFAGSGHFRLSKTILAMPLAFASFGYAIVTAYAGGEIRSPRTSGRRVMLISLAVSVGVVAVLMALSSRTFGNNFLGSSTFLSNAGSKAYTLPAASSFFFYVSMLTSSTVLSVIINISFIIAIVVALPATFLIATRSLFAWSFDRVVPDQLSDVNERTRSPLKANGVVLIVTLIYLALIVFAGGSFLSLLYTSGIAEILTFFVVALAGIVFPYRRRQLYDASPIKQSFLGLPTITVVAAVALAVYTLFFVSLLTASALGANGADGIRATYIIAIIAIIVYPISRAINRRRGVDLGLAFRELPPE